MNCFQGYTHYIWIFYIYFTFGILYFWNLLPYYIIVLAYYYYFDDFN
ncbi:unnamed protein product [Paramecium octaurelia]|uniref:Uncharacterized protein n=1 Tax=Paramecium octaurelia TaxID=43137 RepID=A0A8S1TEE7_PAROT|nr:unnamed protein product [Paramecium octaurelia]